MQNCTESRVTFLASFPLCPFVCVLEIRPKLFLSHATVAFRFLTFFKNRNNRSLKKKGKKKRENQFYTALRLEKAPFWWKLKQVPILGVNRFTRTPRPVACSHRCNAALPNSQLQALTEFSNTKHSHSPCLKP